MDVSFCRACSWLTHWLALACVILTSCYLTRPLKYQHDGAAPVSILQHGEQQQLQCLENVGGTDSRRRLPAVQAKWGRGYWQQDMDQQCYTGVHLTAVSFCCCQGFCVPSGTSWLQLCPQRQTSATASVKDPLEGFPC